MSQFLLPERAKSLLKLERLDKNGWDLVKHSIRPECHGPYLDKTYKALSVGLFDAAINYFWSAVEADLRNKIMSYRIEYFASAVNKPDLRTLDDLKEVKSYELISGCYALGIISEEAHFHLQHAREIRNQFSAAHESVGELDKIETINFLKNCVKYVLCFDLPAPGFSIKEFVESLLVPLKNMDEQVAILRAQSSKIYGPLLNNLFDHWVDPKCLPVLKDNIQLVARNLWDLCDDKVRSQLAVRYASLKERPTPDAADEALDFLKVVGGVEYIPSNLKVAIFKRFSENLLNAHFETNNFYNEPEHANALFALGFDVPPEGAEIYTKALLLSFVGNSYGYSWGAQPYTVRMLEALNSACSNALNHLVQFDPLVLEELSSDKPAEQFIKVAEILLKKSIPIDLKKTLEWVKGKPSEQISKHFRKTHQALG